MSKALATNVARSCNFYGRTHLERFSNTSASIVVGDAIVAERIRSAKGAADTRRSVHYLFNNLSCNADRCALLDSLTSSKRHSFLAEASTFELATSS